MPSSKLILALSVIAAPFAASPISAGSAERAAAAPAGTAETRYCMRIQAMTGSRIETTRCWTREEWADQGVDVDKDWPAEGVRVID